METKKEQTPTAPRPEYCKCNKGHTLQPILNRAGTLYIWDCPTCIESTRQENLADQEADDMEIQMEHRLNDYLEAQE